MSGKTIRGSSDREYRALVQEFAPRPIRGEADLVQIEERIDTLLALTQRTSAEEDYLDLLSYLVRIWEDEHVEIPRLSGIELIKELCHERGVLQRALVPIFGTPSIVSEVLSGKRELQTKHIAAVAEFFQVSPAAFFPAERKSGHPGR